MGERANVFMKDVVEGKEEGVFLYTHWDGYDLPMIVQDAMKRRLRWGDNAYLARIIFSEMIKNDIDGETGYGITTRFTYPDWPTVVVDCANQKVALAARGNDISSNSYIIEWPFEKFIELTKDEIREHYGS